MRWIFEILFFIFQQYLQRRAINQAKKKGILFYLKSLQVARRSLIGILSFICVLQLMLFGLIGTIATGVLLLPETSETKLWILFGISVGLFVLPFAALFVLFSEKIWFHISGAKQMIETFEEAAQDKPAA